MKKFLSRLLLLLPLPAMVLAVNIAVDPGNLYSDGHYERTMAAYLLADSNVANVRDCNERLVHKLYSAGRQDPPDVLVIGSSRSWQIRAAVAAPRTLYNASIPGATLEDYLAVYGMFREAGLLPRTCIISADPWIVNPGFVMSDMHWYTVRESYAYTANLLELATVPDAFVSDGLIAEKLTMALSPRYFQASFTMWLNDVKVALRGGEALHPSPDSIGDGKFRLRDGSLSYSFDYRRKSSDELEALAVSFANRKPFYGMGEFEQLDSATCARFEALLDLMQRDGVQPLLFLAPYHPTTYRILKMEGGFEILSVVEEYYRDLAQRRSLPLAGSYDPQRCASTAADFYDPLHPKEGSVARLLAPLMP